MTSYGFIAHWLHDWSSSSQMWTQHRVKSFKGWAVAVAVVPKVQDVFDTNKNHPPAFRANIYIRRRSKTKLIEIAWRCRFIELSDCWLALTLVGRALYQNCFSKTHSDMFYAHCKKYKRKNWRYSHEKYARWRSVSKVRRMAWEHNHGTGIRMKREPNMTKSAATWKTMENCTIQRERRRIYQQKN